MKMKMKNSMKGKNMKKKTRKMKQILVKGRNSAMDAPMSHAYAHS